YAAHPSTSGAENSALTHRSRRKSSSGRSQSSTTTPQWYVHPVRPTPPHAPLPPCHCPTPTPTTAHADAHVSALQEEITAHLRIYEETKPWKQESVSSRHYRHHGWFPTRRNPGRDDGKTYVSRRFVCGTAVEPASNNAETHNEDVQHEWEAEFDGQEDTAYTRDRARTEVAIMDIAKPAKPRRSAKEYEMVATVRRVIALEEDEWEEYAYEDWELASEQYLCEDWEAVGDEASIHAGPSSSYATVVQRNPG
ncbi:hypothetical protein C8T65DRAFT_635126, partial [Cerioporus squamosus]